MSELSDFLSLRREMLNLSSRKIADLANDAGYRLSHTTAADYIAGRRDNPDDQTINALASALRVKPETIRDLTDRPVNRGEYVPPGDSHNMTAEQRRLVDDVIKMFVHGNQNEEQEPKP